MGIEIGVSGPQTSNMSFKHQTLTIGTAIILVFFGCASQAAAAANRPVPVKPEYARTSEVTIWRADFLLNERLATFEPAHLQGATLASGDVDGDGRDELIVGAGPGRSPDVRIYSHDGTELRRFRAYAVGFKGGVRVAAGDLDGDGKDEIVTAPGPGIAPLIHIFDSLGNKIEGDHEAYQPTFIGGVHVAVADLNQDGKAEIVTTPGPGGGPHVRIWNGLMENLNKDFFAFDASMRDGITVAAIRTPNGAALAIATESWSEPIVRLYSAMNAIALQSEFLVYASSTRSGVTVAAFDKDGDGNDEIAAAPNGGMASDVRIFDIYGTSNGKYLLHDPNYRGGLSMAQIDWHGDGWPELATVALSPLVQGPWDKEKFIFVDLSDQRLYAYERGRIARTFHISSGTRKYPTPVMETKVLSKVPVKTYRWSYGVNHPDNYSLPNVKFNLQIKGPYFIHYAYWHNNFGYRMSHGCINVDKANSEWIYNWADVGIAVKTAY